MEAHGLSGPFPPIHDGVGLAVFMALITACGINANYMRMVAVIRRWPLASHMACPSSRLTIATIGCDEVGV